MFFETLYICYCRIQTRCSRTKKSQLILMRRAAAYSSSCSQVVLVYPQLFRRSSLVICAPQPKIAKKVTKTVYFWVQDRLRSFIVISFDTS